MILFGNTHVTDRQCDHKIPPDLDRHNIFPARDLLARVSYVVWTFEKGIFLMQHNPYTSRELSQEACLEEGEICSWNRGSKANETSGRQRQDIIWPTALLINYILIWTMFGGDWFYLGTVCETSSWTGVVCWFLTIPSEQLLSFTVMHASPISSSHNCNNFAAMQSKPQLQMWFVQ